MRKTYKKEGTLKVFSLWRDIELFPYRIIVINEDTNNKREFMIMNKFGSIFNEYYSKDFCRDNIKMTLFSNILYRKLRELK